MQTPLYPTRSYLNPRIAVHPSAIDRLGLFATGPIQTGETMIIWGGRLLTDAEIPALEAAFARLGRNIVAP